ncbi:MAG: purine-nucleoside phosphorylase [Chloroflexi bacterium]|nr:MAG: purine-nucleoside phosphorylase [Chloroflexota bacterium]
MPGADAAVASTAERVAEAAKAVRARAELRPRVALILGSGLGELADEIQSPVVVPYTQIPNFPVSTVTGHAGQLVLGELQGTPVVAMRGRIHFYEGYSLREVAFPVRVLRRLGAEVLIVTNAAGGLNESFSTGDLMVLTDHLNMMGMAGQSPLVGPDEPELGVRFLDMLSAYDAELRTHAHRVAEQHGFALREGIYAMVGGPAYETLAEIRFLQRAGADAVGMSTIPEVLVARHEGMRVLGISAITDMAVGKAAVHEISHADVLAAAERIKPRLAAIVRGVLNGFAACPHGNGSRGRSPHRAHAWR